MPTPNRPQNYQHLVLPGIITCGLLWAFSLLGFGLWQQLQQTQPSPVSTEERPSEYSTFRQVDNVPSGRFKYGGSPDWSPIRLVVDSTIQSERREYQLSYIQPKETQANTTTAIALLIQGKLDFVQSDRALKSSELTQAQQQGLTLKQTSVATDGIAIAVHPSLPIQGLTLQQIADIYTGSITNWTQVGGPNLEIKPFALSFESEGMLDLFLKQVMQGKSFSQQLDYFPNMTTALRKLADSPGGIFFGSAAEIVPQCTVKPLPVGPTSRRIAPYQSPYIEPSDCPNPRNQINTQAILNQEYPLTHPLYVIYASNRDNTQAGEAYTQLLLSSQGQDLLSKAGFVKIAPSSPIQ
ncbi:substrate-binding domain-containing protein [Acaryochloris sp. IP29b_bin.137]|uniref:substrate-binding domain-containing protein n=1 Tax=Acaryochloris sp. IP29b_bin.137 TaxID=2969217 RepID=UPI002613FAAB|nr:substrate-binding domain-containing protein [Acaryochloris sp. IP29b_bin.137]